jgi:hypothetical protein
MLAESLGDKAFFGTTESGDERRLMGSDPAVLREFQELTLAQATSGLVVETLDGGGPVFELGDPEASGELAIFPMQPFVIDEQTDKLGLAQTLVILALEALLEGTSQGEDFVAFSLSSVCSSNIIVILGFIYNEILRYRSCCFSYLGWCLLLPSGHVTIGLSWLTAAQPPCGLPRARQELLGISMSVVVSTPAHIHRAGGRRRGLQRQLIGQWRCFHSFLQRGFLGAVAG